MQSSHVFKTSNGTNLAFEPFKLKSGTTWFKSTPTAAYWQEFGREYIASMKASSHELRTFLLATPFFGGLSDASLDLLISMLTERHYDTGDTIVEESDAGRSMFVVRSGSLVVSKHGALGNSVPINNLKAGDFFGEMTLIEMQSRSATVLAEGPTILYELTAQNLYSYYKIDIYGYVIVLQNINRELCRRLRRADSRITDSLHGFDSERQ